MAVGASVILFDPIFQGLAIALMAGEVAKLLFWRMTVPILCFTEKRWASAFQEEQEIESSRSAGAPITRRDRHEGGARHPSLLVDDLAG